MSGRISRIALPAITWTTFLVAVAWPTIALVAACATPGAPPAQGFTFGARSWTLLSRTLGISAAATALCLLLSLPAAYALGRSRDLARRPLVVALLLTLLLTPPMVCVFGWQRILPAAMNAHVRCIGAWALWAWPILAMLLGAGWARAARGAHEAATLVASPWSAFLHVALPILARYIAFGALIVFVLFFGDYGVPHACGLTVYATEVLGWAQESSRTIDVLWPALPGVAVVGTAVWLMLRTSSRLPGDGDEAAGAPHDLSIRLPAGSRRATLWHRLRAGGGAALGATIALFAVSWLVPIGWLAVKLGSAAAYARAIETYAPDLGWSLVVAVVSGVGVVGMGLGVSGAGRWSRLALVWSVVLGALPGGLVGVALVAAYNNGLTYEVYDHWPIMALSYAARFAWIGLITGLLVAGRRSSPLTAQARTDGADDASILTRVYVPMHVTTLLSAVAATAALALADVAASSLVRVPSYNPIAHVLIEKYHRFEDDMLVSLSLWLVAAVVPAATLLAWVIKRRKR